MSISRFHHVAYRCKDAGETVAFYKTHLGLELVGAFAEDHVPSTKAPDPYMHIFIGVGPDNILAFFELPNSPEMSRDLNTPDWVQHIALEMDSMDELIATRDKLAAGGVDVIGPIDHALFQSIYFRDPNGHRLELAVNTATPEQQQRMKDVAQLMVDDWSKTKTPPRHMAWAHELELKKH
jgi:glyoxylase I family protein